MANRSHKLFKPFLCRFSENDTVQPSKLPDPSSPKLTFFGQMKNKPTTTLSSNLSASINAKSSVHSNRYKHFSVKNLISPAIETTSIKSCNTKCVMNRSRSCNGRGRMRIGSRKCYASSSDDHDALRVVVDQDLDPPLPVVKSGRGDQEVNVNLWKRRGLEMKTLKIQPIHVTMNRNSGGNNGD